MSESFLECHDSNHSCCQQPIALIQLGLLAKWRISPDKRRCSQNDFWLHAESQERLPRNDGLLKACRGSWSSILDANFRFQQPGLTADTALRVFPFADAAGR